MEVGGIGNGWNGGDCNRQGPETRVLRERGYGDFCLILLM